MALETPPVLLGVVDVAEPLAEDLRVAKRQDTEGVRMNLVSPHGMSRLGELPGGLRVAPLAARYTDEGASNFDIYLPNWLASHNKTVFGTLFVVNELIALWCWLKRARSSSANDGGTL